MIGPSGLTQRLAVELAALNESQREAAIYPASLVVRAGPGSGKTRTLVAKAAYALESVIPGRRGLAAITYTRHAAQEIARRLDVLDVNARDRLVAGTLHSWCLRCIIRPFGPLVGVTPPGPGDVIDDKSDEWTALLQQCLDDETVGAIAGYAKVEVGRIRRRMAAGSKEDDRDPLVRAALKMERRMRDRHRYDFDLMVSESLALLRRNPRVTQLLAARFPLLIVDEYQDLGPVLHQLVVHLRDHGGVEVAAFGDPDQTIMGFTGADPTFLIELASRPDFFDTTLNINYRCGSAIITASHATVDGDRAHQADPLRADPGVVELISVQGAIAEHAAMTISKIDELAASDVEQHHIAVLYPSKGPLLDALVDAFDASIFEYVHENDQRLPDGDLVDFVRSCGARAIAGPQPIGYPDIDRASAVPTIGQLVVSYRALHESAGLPVPRRRFATRLISTALRTVSPDMDLAGWVKPLDAEIGITDIAASSPLQRDRDAIALLQNAAVRNRLTVGDVAGALRTGKVTLTTYHAAKGREWDYVILPGLIDGVMPKRRWNKATGIFVPAPAHEVEQSRRAFYVGLTRAKRAAILIEGDHWLSPWGAPNRYGVSPFSHSVRMRLGLGP
ncbi:ATP-dependent helicase [Dactylosporangium darangshiense]|uniref:DNA 3'-5' helicase n=1 Tax=Dactylosporangium darangshiense TaxID=579108 RepID=A0ABP8DA94_9ACTN